MRITTVLIFKFKERFFFCFFFVRFQLAFRIYHKIEYFCPSILSWRFFFVIFPLNNRIWRCRMERFFFIHFYENERVKKKNKNESIHEYNFINYIMDIIMHFIIVFWLLSILCIIFVFVFWDCLLINWETNGFVWNFFD